MAKRKHDIKKELKRWFSCASRIVIAGIGNPIRMDDSVGLKIIQGLKEKVSDKVLLIECETIPESYIEQIVSFDPTHVLLIDAAILGIRPGDAKLVQPKRLSAHPAFSTHILPLRIFCEYLTRATRAKIALLLIEPKKTDFGEGLTPEIESSAQSILAALLESL